jgi:RNA-binding protein
MSTSIKLNPPTLLTHVQKRHLRTLGHHLNAIVQIGKFGITPTWIEALKQALARHELVKVSINGESPTEREVAATSLVKTVGAHLVQMVGRTLILYRAKEENPVIILPKATKSKDQIKNKDQKQDKKQTVATAVVKETPKPKAQITDDAEFDDAEFDDAEFDDAEFDDAEFDDAEFDDAEFDDAEFDDADDFERLNAYQNQNTWTEQDDEDWGEVLPKERMIDGKASVNAKQDQKNDAKSSQSSRYSTPRKYGTHPSRPGSSKPGSSRPGSSKPGSSRPGSSKSGSSRPGSSKSGSSRPGSSKSSNARPSSSRAPRSSRSSKR